MPSEQQGHAAHESDDGGCELQTAERVVRLLCFGFAVVVVLLLIHFRSSSSLLRKQFGNRIAKLFGKQPSTVENLKHLGIIKGCIVRVIASDEPIPIIREHDALHILGTLAGVARPRTVIVAGNRKLNVVILIPAPLLGWRNAVRIILEGFDDFIPQIGTICRCESVSIIHFRYSVSFFLM
nr:MAG TPA: hypothetical protein [Caudoviricetes sp.]